MKMREELNTLLELLGPIYDKSDTKKICEKERQKWGYSLVTSAMERSAPLILGFNWGANQKEIYQNQKSVDLANFEKEDVGSLKRIFPFIRSYFGEEYLSKVSQSNYCFFRSKTEAEISPADIERCKPIFDKLVEILEPSAILCFSSKLRKYLIESNQVLDLKERAIKFGRGSRDIEFVAAHGTFASGVGIRFLPHPNYPMKRDARAAAWQFCCAKGT